MYVTSPVQEVRFFAEVDDIVPAREAELSKPVESYDSIAHFDSDKKVVTFKSGSLYELKDPIPYGGGKTPYSLRYTDLQSFRNAKTTDDIL